MSLFVLQRDKSDQSPTKCGHLLRDKPNIHVLRCGHIVQAKTGQGCGHTCLGSPQSLPDRPTFHYGCFECRKACPMFRLDLQGGIPTLPTWVYHLPGFELEDPKRRARAQLQRLRSPPLESCAAQTATSRHLSAHGNCANLPPRHTNNNRPFPNHAPLLSYPPTGQSKKSERNKAVIKISSVDAQASRKRKHNRAKQAHLNRALHHQTHGSRGPSTRKQAMHERVVSLVHLPRSRKDVETLTGGMADVTLHGR